MFEIRTYLKENRMNKKITANAVAKKLSMSQGHVSGIENKLKNVPNERFIEKYIQAISNDVEEYKKFSEEIFIKSNGRHILSDEVKEEFMGSKFINKDNRHAFFNKDGELVENGFDFPINDLEYHLTNENNSLFYKGEKLSDDDKMNIQKLVKDYLVNFEIAKEKTLHDLNADGIISDKQLNDELFKIKGKVRKIKY